MKVSFHISTAGIAGDPHKLLIAETGSRTEREMFNSNSLWSLRRAKRRLMKRLEILTGRKPVEAD